MTNAEIIEKIESAEKNNADYVKFHIETECQTIKQALEKQEPKKVIQHGKEGDDLCWFECPMCGVYLAGYWQNETLCYCSECGQKLSWENE